MQLGGRGMYRRGGGANCPPAHLLPPTGVCPNVSSPCSTLPTEWAEKLRALIQIHGPIPVKVAAPPAYPADTPLGPRETPTFVGLVCACVCVCVCVCSFDVYSVPLCVVAWGWRQHWGIFHFEGKQQWLTTKGLYTCTYVVVVG